MNISNQMLQQKRKDNIISYQQWKTGAYLGKAAIETFNIKYKSPINDQNVDITDFHNYEYHTKAASWRDHDRRLIKAEMY